MGMSASQARLLTLTARQHDVEWKAQKLQAEKLRLANDSDRVYNTYLEALSATKIQARVCDKWESDTFKDATLAMLENGVISGYAGETASTPLFLQEISTGRLMITPEYAASIGITADSVGVGNKTLEEFLYDEGHTKTKIINTTYPLIPDPDVNNHKVVSYSGAVANSAMTPYSSWYSNFTPVENDNSGGFDEAELAQYASFDDTHNSSITGIAVSTVTSFTSGQTYTISNAADLDKLRELSQSGAATDGVNFVLTSDIDLTGYDWDGIKDFKGSFDGNGYTINNLTGTQGLFANVTNATIKNVGVNVGEAGINGTTNNVGGLIGSANGQSTVIDNCYVKGGDIKGTNNVGGLIGYANNIGSLTNVYTTVNVSGIDNIGGLVGDFEIRPGNKTMINGIFTIGNVTGTNCVGGLFGKGYFDPDTKDWSYNTEINNVYTGGTITGDSAVGGFVGDMFYWADYGDHLWLNNCDTAAKVEGGDNRTGIYFGYLHENTADTGGWNADNGYTPDSSLHFKDSGYAVNMNPDLGSNTDNPTIVGELSNADTDLSTSEDVSSFIVSAKIPSINADGTGSYYSNIIGVLVKSGLYDPANMTAADIATMENNVKNFLLSFNDNNTDNTKLYYLNEKICEYLNAADNSGDEAFAQALYNDVLQTAKINTTAYQTGDDIGTIKRSELDLSWDKNIQFNENLGTLTIPNLNVIKKELTYALMIGNDTLDEASAGNMAQSFLDKYTNVNAADDIERNTDRAYLAKVNEILYNYSQTGVMNGDVIALLAAVKNGNKYTVMPAGIDDISHYEISIDTNDKSNLVSAQRQASMIEDKNNPIYEYDWDWDDPAIIASVNKYNTLKTGFIIIGDNTKSADYDAINMHESTNWLTNVINAGIAQFVKYDYEAFKKVKEAGNNVENIDLVFYGTSIANETSLQEVQDTEMLKKAEATYEANMRKINRKETKIDTDLSQLEAERTAIKTEQDTLKNVAKDNVDLTFKLFS